MYEFFKSCQGWRHLNLVRIGGLNLKTDEIYFDKTPQVVSHLQVDVTNQDLACRIKISGNNPEILNGANKTLDAVKRIWNPSAIYCWCEFQQTESNTVGRIQNQNRFSDIDFGCSIKFLKHASHVLVAVYTTGHELELASKKVSEKSDYLSAYFLDLIGLIVLEKTSSFIKQIAEKKAAESGWGLSPFLSPGSVHGWDLSEQLKLCSLLPIEKINVTIRDDAIFFPFKTISCLIGSGLEYDTVKVGTTCQVCSKNHECQLKQI